MPIRLLHQPCRSRADRYAQRGFRINVVRKGHLEIYKKRTLQGVPVLIAQDKAFFQIRPFIHACQSRRHTQFSFLIGDKGFILHRIARIRQLMSFQFGIPCTPLFHTLYKHRTRHFSTAVVSSRNKSVRMNKINRYFSAIHVGLEYQAAQCHRKFCLLSQFRKHKIIAFLQKCRPSATAADFAVKFHSNQSRNLRGNRSG